MTASGVGSEVARQSRPTVTRWPPFSAMIVPCTLPRSSANCFVEILLRQTPDVVLTKYRRVHFVLRFIRCCANLAANRIAAFMLDSSAFPLPAMS